VASTLKVNIVGDAKKFTKSTKQAESSLQKLGKATTSTARLMKGALGSIGLALSFTALTQTLRAATQGAIAEAKSQALLEKQLQNTVKATKLQTAAIEESISKMSIMAAIPDDEIRPAFATLLRSTRSVAKATKLTSLALDVSAGTGKDVGTVSKALSKAYNGNTGALSKLGINVKKGGNWMKDLRKQFAGMADIAARKDPAKRLQVTFSELEEKLGEGMIPTLNKLADWFNANYDKIAKFFTDAWNSDFVKDAKDVLKTVWKDVLVPFGEWLMNKDTQEAFKKFGNSLANLFRSASDFDKTDLSKTLSSLADAAVLQPLRILANVLDAIADSLDAIRNGAQPAAQALSAFNPYNSNPSGVPLTTADRLKRGSGTFSDVGRAPVVINNTFNVQKMTGDEIIAQANKALRKSGKGRLVFDG